MTNFDYLKDCEGVKHLYELCCEVECRQTSDPGTSALYARNVLDWIVQAIYRLEDIGDANGKSLFQLMNDDKFVRYINDASMMQTLHYIRKIGNIGAHNPSSVKRNESYFVLRQLHGAVGAVLMKFGLISSFPDFDDKLIPGKPRLRVAPTATAKSVSDEVQTVKATPKQGSLNKSQYKTVFTEDETRKLFIDIMLKEAGWDILTEKGLVAAEKACIEIKVEGMPKGSGIGYADYVLYGKDGKPLAVIEAKRTSKDVDAGRQQAEQYADCLERKYGRRPVIYYSNGFVTKVIDGCGYPDRQIYGFHRMEDLEALIKKRGRITIKDMVGNPDIAGRDYQLRAEKAICEHFNKMFRRSLLVMPTGTGKTRTAVGVVELLKRNNRVNNILFLADRTTLVEQAMNSFVKYLPSETVENISAKSDPELNKSITFSTYQTAINLIDKEEKKLSIGHFDLIIIDEAHRSIFGKYKSILSYFDALVLGMTATPKDEIDKNTFELMELEEPNFEYTWKEAVDEKHIVDAHGFDYSTKFMKEGIKYADLSKKEKEQLESLWEYEKLKNGIPEDQEYHRDINPEEINKYLVNYDTIDKMLRVLMEKGLRVNNGETIGKTIIFASDHNMASLIVERFRKVYPEFGPDFCQLIDYSVKNALNIVQNFCASGGMPQIAVSVDMLDTGVDAPEVVNLVFYKRVKSWIKFTQMKGRGVRLCKNLYGDMDKDCFYIFDWCGNLDYFSQQTDDGNERRQKSISERIFGVRAEIALELQHPSFQQDEKAKALHDKTKKWLREQVVNLNDARIAVREKMQSVVRFRAEESWENLITADVFELKSAIAPLMIGSDKETVALQFDLLSLQYMLEFILEHNVDAARLKKRIKNLVSMLYEKISIPQVKEKEDVIKVVGAEHFWDGISVDRIEWMREELRDLMKFLVSKTESKMFYTNITDRIESGLEIDKINDARTYKQKVFDYLMEHNDSPVFAKIRNMQKLSADEWKELEEIFWTQLGTREQYNLVTSEHDFNGYIPAFVRTIIGVDYEKALDIYREFIHGREMTSMQESCLKEIVQFVCANGDIEAEKIPNIMQLKHIDWGEIFNNDIMHVKEFIDTLHDAVVA